MTKLELIRKVTASAKVPTTLKRREVEAVVDALFEELTQYFIEARPVVKSGRGRQKAARFNYPGFGTFVKCKRAGRTTRHPSTGAPVEIPETVTLQFVIGELLKQQLNARKK